MIRHALCLLLIISLPPTAAAQTGLTGTVRDETGLALPGATVEVRRADGQLLRAIVTGPDGGWSVPAIPAGALLVSVRLVGFRPETHDVEPGRREPIFTT